MYIPNFSFLAQFGGQLCEEQTQEIRKPDQKTTPLWQSREEMRFKRHKNWLKMHKIDQKLQKSLLKKTENFH